MRTLVYSVGLVSLSACAEKEATVEEVTADVNAHHPTGIESRWSLAKEKQFASGEPMPCPCQHDPNRTHYLFHC